MDRLLWNVFEVGTALNLSRSTVNRLVKLGVLESGKVGGRRLILAESVKAYANSLGKAA